MSLDKIKIFSGNANPQLSVEIISNLNVAQGKAMVGGTTAVILAAEERFNASTIISNSIKVSAGDGPQVGCKTNTSQPRGFLKLCLDKT
jgi:hypothetical protein